MLNTLANAIIEGGLQAIGWALMKAVTFGRYRGFQPEDVLFEGSVGFGALIVVGYVGYHWLW